MKAWELIKHLEEGGEIEDSEGSRRRAYYIDKNDIYDLPNQFKIVKPRKKIKLYAYLKRQASLAQNGSVDSYKLLFFDRDIKITQFIRIKEMDKEFEVDEK